MSIAARIEQYLTEHGVRYELVSHKTTGSTHESAVAAHVPEDHIAKAVMVRDAQGDAIASLGVVYCEAGDHQHLLRISGEDFRTLLQGARRGYFSGESSSSDPLWSSAEG